MLFFIKIKKRESSSFRHYLLTTRLNAVILYYFFHLFISLTFGHYPKLLSAGYIIVIPFQSNDIFDPNNYRGITFTNAIGKHLNTNDGYSAWYFSSITLLMNIKMVLIEKRKRQAMCIFFRQLLISVVVLRMVECMAAFFIFKVLRHSIQLFAQDFFSNSSELM